MCRRTIALALLTLFGLAGRGTGQITSIVSAASTGFAGNGASDAVSLSADGRFVAFESVATNFVPGDTNNNQDVFVHDRLAGETTRVSVTSSGVQANGMSGHPAISGDGRFVAFESRAANLVAGDSNGVQDILLKDRLTGVTARVSLGSGGEQANADCLQPAISADGRFVAFSTSASSLSAADFNGVSDIYVKDTSTGHLSIASVSSLGLLGDKQSVGAALSADGRYVAFRSRSATLTIGDINGVDDIFVHDNQTGSTTRVNVSSSGQQTSGIVGFPPAISADGRYVAFDSDAPGLVATDANGADIFVHDRQTGETSLMSISSTGEQANGDCHAPAISADGRYVAFMSEAADLVDGDTNGAIDVFRHDRETGQTIRVSVLSGGAQSTDHSSEPSISQTGKYVAYASEAHLSGVDHNSWSDVYLTNNAMPWAPLGGGIAGTHGTPALSGAGTLEGLTVMTLALSDALELAPTFLVTGFRMIGAGFKGGVLVPAPDFIFPLMTDGGGSLALPALWPPGVPSDVTLWFQCWLPDPAGALGYAASNGLSLTTP
jgi:Tol biopolymer transport system component